VNLSLCVFDKKIYIFKDYMLQKSGQSVILFLIPVSI